MGEGIICGELWEGVYTGVSAGGRSLQKRSVCY